MKTRYLRLVKKQRGFTLIELLAVILILGIIALIAIPTVTSVVEQSRKGAAESSAASFINSVEELIISSDLEQNKISDGFYTINELKEKGLNIQGTLPNDGIVQIKNQNVVAYNLFYKEYTVSRNEDGNEISKVATVFKYNLTEDNDANNEISIGDKVCLDTECFYIYKIDEDNVKMISEWNLNVGYNLSYNNSKEFLANMGYKPDNDMSAYVYNGVTYTKINTKKTQIKQDSEYRGGVLNSETGLSSFNGVINFTKIYNNNDLYNRFAYWTDYLHNLKSKYGTTYPTFVYDSGSVLYEYIDAYETNLKLKSAESNFSLSIISLDEALELGCSTLTGQCTNAPSWLYNTSYWTGTVTDYLLGYSISNRGRLTNMNAALADGIGVRPTMIIAKSLINK